MPYKWEGAQLADKGARAVVMSVISGLSQIYVERGDGPHHTRGRQREVSEVVTKRESRDTQERGGEERGESEEAAEAYR